MSRYQNFNDSLLWSHQTLDKSTHVLTLKKALVAAIQNSKEHHALVTYLPLHPKCSHTIPRLNGKSLPITKLTTVIAR